MRNKGLKSKIVIIFLSIFFGVFGLPQASWAAPVISGTNGEFTDNSAIAISGNGFSSHNLNIEWLGGINGNIEQGNIGQTFLKTNWITNGDAGGFTSPKYNNTKAHSYSNSIWSYVPPEKWGSGFGFNNRVPIESAYVTWWVYADPNESTAGQWKMWRIRPNSSVGDVQGEIMSSQWYNTDETNSMFYAMLFCGTSKNDYSQCYPDLNAGLRWLSGGPNIRDWTRIEYYAKESSADGVRDGSFHYGVHRQTEPVREVAKWIGNIITRAAGVNERWQYIHWQNYIGNGLKGSAYVDDPYIQIGTQSRIELADTPIFSTNTHREIQIPSSWSDNSITFTLNQGSFQNGQNVYFFVIDESGNPSAGYPITLGGSTPEPDTTPPSAPSGVAVN